MRRTAPVDHLSLRWVAEGSESATMRHTSTWAPNNDFLPRIGSIEGPATRLPPG